MPFHGINYINLVANASMASQYLYSAQDLLEIKSRQLSLSQMLYGVVLLPGNSSDYFTDSNKYFPDSDKQVFFIDGSYYYASVQRILSEPGLAVQVNDESYVTSLPFPIDIDTSKDLDSLRLIRPYDLHG